MSVKDDAITYAKAKLEHGEGAGNLRKAVGARLSEKMKDISYAEKFNEELAKIDMAKIQAGVDRSHAIKAVCNTAKSGLNTTKKVLAGLGITAATAIPFYLSHKQQCDEVIGNVKNNIVNGCKKTGKAISNKTKDILDNFKNKLPKKKKEKSFMDKIDSSSYNQE